MFIVRKNCERGITRRDWFESRHTFSFGRFFDPKYNGFALLKTLNEHIIQPNHGYDFHFHENLEILTIILSGELLYNDSLGNSALLSSGDVQKISTGSGIYHSEYNNSSEHPLHFLQAWVLPAEKNISPSIEKKSDSQNLNTLINIASFDGKDGSLKIAQNINVYQILIEKDETLNYKHDADNKLWLHVADGFVDINKKVYNAGDALGYAQEDDSITIKGVAELSKIILFEMK